MSRPYHRHPQPYIHRFARAGERLRVGALVEYRPDPTDRRHWLLFTHSQPGGDHQNLFVAPDRGLEYVEEGDDALVIQIFGACEFPAILRRGEKVNRGQYELGMKYGSPLVSAGDGTGALVHGSRFVNAARVCGTATEDLDLTDAEEDGIVVMRTQIYIGEIAVAG